MTGGEPEVTPALVTANLREPVVAIDGSGDIAFVNERFLDVTQFSRENALGEDFDRIERIVEDGFAELCTAVEAVQNGEANEKRVELSMCHPESAPVERRLPAEARITPLEADDRAVGILVALRDISDRNEKRRELRRQNERLEEFASVVSHDLRNPLSVAKGQLEVAREEDDSERLREIDRALDRMTEIISDTLALARQGKSVGDTERVEVAPFLEECWQYVDTGDVTLQVDDEFAVTADPERLRTLFENLVRNALEHGDASVVRVGRIDHSGFYVEDDGSGLPEGEREQLFDAGETSGESGTGFGLAIVRRIAQAHGWEVTATDSGSGGARFETTGVDIESG